MSKPVTAVSATAGTTVPSRAGKAAVSRSDLAVPGASVSILLLSPDPAPNVAQSSTLLIPGAVVSSTAGADAGAA
jgi:hypothetical protein